MAHSLFLIESSFPAVDAEHLPVDEARELRGEKDDAIGDILRRAEALHRDALDERLLPLRPITLPLLLRRRVRAHEAGRHAVHRDAEGPKLMGELARQPDERVLCRAIGLNARKRGLQARARADVDDPALPRPL